MADIVLTPQPEIGAMWLRFDPDAGEYVSSIYRTDVNGTAQVRTLLGVLPSDPDDLVNVYDQEAALAGEVSYEITSSVTVYTVAATMEGAQPWLTVVLDPKQASAVPLVLNYNGGRQASSTVHEIVGRTDPLVTLGVLRTRQGMLEFWCPDHATVRTLERLYAKNMVMLLREPLHPGMDLYHVPTGTDISPLSIEGRLTRWGLRVNYIEVKRPSGNVLGTLGWDYDDVAASYPDYASLLAVYEDYEGLEIGPLA